MDWMKCCVSGTFYGYISSFLKYSTVFDDTFSPMYVLQGIYSVFSLNKHSFFHGITKPNVVYIRFEVVLLAVLLFICKKKV